MGTIANLYWVLNFVPSPVISTLHISFTRSTASRVRYYYKQANRGCSSFPWNTASIWLSIAAWQITLKLGGLKNVFFSLRISVGQEYEEG